MAPKLTLAERAEINRNNAKKSTGPTSAEGKERIKFNAMKHGMAAKTLVLPGEDAAKFQRKLNGWLSDWRTGSNHEHDLVTQAVTALWMNERAIRAETAHLSKIILDAVAAEDDRVNNEVDELGRQLLPDLYPPLPLETSSEGEAGEPEALSSGTACGPVHPASIVHGLEATSTGCSWLHDRWAELRSPLLEGIMWQPPEMNRAIRLLGAEISDAAEVPDAAKVIFACHVLDPQQYEASANGRLEGPALASSPGLVAAGSTTNPVQLGSTQRTPLYPPFARGEEKTMQPAQSLHCEGAEAESQQVQRNSTLERSGSNTGVTLSPAQAEARQTLIDTVDQAMARLKDKEERAWEQELDELSSMTARLSFDPSKTGERLRQSHMYWSRTFSRTFETLLKIRRSGSGVPRICSAIGATTGSFTEPDDIEETMAEFRSPITAYEQRRQASTSSMSGSTLQSTVCDPRPNLDTQGLKNPRTQGLKNEGLKDQGLHKPTTSVPYSRPEQPQQSPSAVSPAQLLVSAGHTEVAGHANSKNEAKPAANYPTNSKNEAKPPISSTGCATVDGPTGPTAVPGPHANGVAPQQSGSSNGRAAAPAPRGTIGQPTLTAGGSALWDPTVTAIARIFGPLLPDSVRSGSQWPGHRPSRRNRFTKVVGRRATH
jgi:hypothetical protein